MAPKPMAKDICCQNFKGLASYVRKHYGDDGFAKLTHGLLSGDYYIQDKYHPSTVMPIDEEHLVDPAYWVSNEFSLRLLHNVNAVVDGDAPLREAGRGMVKESLSRTTLFFARFLGLRVIANRVAHINRQFNRTKDVALVDIGDNSARFELIYKPDFEVTKDVCEWNLGIYIGIAELAGQRQVWGRETDCVLSGGDCCRFEIRWDKQSVFSGLIRRFLAAMQRWLAKDLVADYERILKERDLLIGHLETSERKYRTLFEESQEALSLSRQGILVDVNPAWLRMHAYAGKAEVIGKAVSSFVHPEDRSILSGKDADPPATTQRMAEIRGIKQSGEIMDLEVYFSRIEYDGNRSLLAMVKDVTDRKRAAKKKKRLEARVARAEKMETVATLAGGVAHDLNNILSGIVGYPELIMMDLPQDSPLKKPIETMHRSAQKAAAIVQDMLTLSRRGAVAKETIQINTVVQDYVNSLECKKMLSYHPQVSIQADLADDLLTIRASAVHVSKIVMNLVSNAAEAMPEGGIIEVRTKNRHVDTEVQADEAIAQGDYCELCVSDTGVGMSAEDLDKMFEPFFTKKKMGRSGTGLGMAVVWGSVKDHDGHILVESGLGKGTDIRILLPASRDRLAGLETKTEIETLRGNGEHILVVDDIQDQLDIATDMLHRLGYSVAGVSGGQAALDYLETTPCDLIILDMIMDPGMDGLETWSRIIERHPRQKAILSSGYSETDRVKAAQRLGAGDYLRKPYTLDKIGRAVQNALNKPGLT